jgi:hypothetical protein
MRSLSLVFLLLAACGAPGASATPDAAAVVDAQPDALGPFEPVVAAADVSILYPLSPTTRDGLIAAAEVGAYGPLLPEDLVAGHPYPLDIDGDTYADMRLVAVRLDPCSARGGCASELRAVYQPIVVRGGAVSASDGAVHVFYAIPPAELLEVLKEILALKHAHGAGVVYPDALGPQPILAATGLAGDFAHGLHRVLLKHLGAQRIARVTFMRHEFPDEDAWQFVLFERVGDAFVTRPIAHTQSPQQLLFGPSATGDQIGGIRTAVDSTPTLPELGALASTARPAQVTPTIEAGFAQAIAAQHPLAHSSEDTDCGSCHVAEGARRAGTELYGLAVTGAFTSARSLSYVRQTKPLTNFHAFGYLGTSISIMQRTANESALVADRMQASLTR